ncbi:hypothetical protein HHK36_033353 [Tetracentron sinense]|uniref:Uncharacterized protein n=1 Tax=Tetracentron sinense TaxID=13715 RepID=A0A834Y7Q4_TETSI|nr:hypothetical protein HHK36_033353 [Tetracentron sinense]
MAYRRKQAVSRASTFKEEIRYPPDDNSSSSLAAQAIRASSAHLDSSLSSAYGESAIASAYRESSRQRSPSSEDSASYEYTSMKSLNESKNGFWGILAKKAKAILEDDNATQQSETPGRLRPQMIDTSTGGQPYQSPESCRKTDSPKLRKGFDAITSSLNYIGNAFEVLSSERQQESKEIGGSEHSSQANQSRLELVGEQDQGTVAGGLSHISLEKLDPYDLGEVQGPSSGAAVFDQNTVRSTKAHRDVEVQRLVAQGSEEPEVLAEVRTQPSLGERGEGQKEFQVVLPQMCEEEVSAWVINQLEDVGDQLDLSLDGLEGLTIVENRTADIIQETRKLHIRKKGSSSEPQNQPPDVRNSQKQPKMQTQMQPLSQTDQETQLKASRDVAMAMAAKAKLLLRELKTVKADLAFAKERCTQLEEENRILRESREKGDNPEDDDLIRLQLETLLAEKARLAHENSIYARENRFLREIVEYHQLTMQDVVYLDEGIEEVTEVYPVSIPAPTNGCFIAPSPEAPPSGSPPVTKDVSPVPAPPPEVAVISPSALPPGSDIPVPAAEEIKKTIPSA